MPTISGFTCTMHESVTRISLVPMIRQYVQHTFFSTKSICMNNLPHIYADVAHPHTLNYGTCEQTRFTISMHLAMHWSQYECHRILKWRKLGVLSCQLCLVVSNERQIYVFTRVISCVRCIKCNHAHRVVFVLDKNNITLCRVVFVSSCQA